MCLDPADQAGQLRRVSAGADLVDHPPLGVNRGAGVDLTVRVDSDRCRSVHRNTLPTESGVAGGRGQSCRPVITPVCGHTTSPGEEPRGLAPTRSRPAGPTERFRVPRGSSPSVTVLPEGGTVASRRTRRKMPTTSVCGGGSSGSAVPLTGLGPRRLVGALDGLLVEPLEVVFQCAGDAAVAVALAGLAALLGVDWKRRTSASWSVRAGMNSTAGCSCRTFRRSPMRRVARQSDHRRPARPSSHARDLIPIGRRPSPER